MPEQIPCRLGPGATRREIQDEDFNAILRHPARQARLAYRALLLCPGHDIAHKTTRRCEHCRAHDGQILGAKVNCPKWAKRDADFAAVRDEWNAEEVAKAAGAKVS
jgi:hypothetical protein